MESKQRPPSKRNDSPRAPIELEQIRRINEYLKLFGEPKPERLDFKAGSTIINEGQPVHGKPAILVIQGRLQQSKSLVVEGHGVTEQVLSIIREGEVGNIQAIIPEHSSQPSFCTLRALEDGFGYVIYPENISNLNSLGIIVYSLLRQNSVQWEVFAGTSNAYSTFALLLTNLKKDFPRLPTSPIEFLRLFQKAARERNELRKQATQRDEREKRQAETNRELNDRIAELEHELEATRKQLTGAQNSQARQQPSELSQQVIQLHTANTAMQRDLNQEARARKALELRIAELTKQLATQSSAASHARFPSANLLLESSQLAELEAEAKWHEDEKIKFHTAANHFELMLSYMQLGVEELGRINPGLTMNERAMMFFTGQHPDDTSEVAPSGQPKPTRDSTDFQTVHYGSEDPVVAGARARAHQQTAVIGPSEHAPQRAPRPDPQPAATHDVERFPTMDETPLAKRGPDGMPSSKLASRKKTDREITAVEAPEAIRQQRGGRRSGEHHAPPQNNPLSVDDVDAILHEFVTIDDQPATPRISAPPSSTRVSAPYPGGPEEYSWSDEEEPSSSQTRPFLPDSDHPAPGIEVSIPPEPPTPRLSEPARMKTPIDGVRRTERICHDGKISQRHMHPVDHGPGGFTEREEDSDITPISPLFDSEKPPSLRPPSQNQTRDWEDNPVLARPGQMPIEERETPTRREGSSSKHPAVTFPDEGTDVRQIQEDWQNALRQPQLSADPDEFPIPPSADIPPPPAGIFGEIEPPSSLGDLVDEKEADPSELSDGIELEEVVMTTQVYSSPGTALPMPDPPEPTSDDIRATRAYQFKAPGKPPKPES
jgi:hypothetical protein